MAGGRGSRVLGAPVGLRTPLRGDQWTVPLGLRLSPGRRCRRRPLPPPPPTPRTKPPPPRLSERRRRQIFSPVLATGRGACREMQSQVWGAGGERRKRPVSREEGPEREREM